MTPEGGLATTVDLAFAVSDGDHEDEESVVINLVDDPVIPGSHPPLAVTPDELSRTSGAGLGTQKLDRGLYPPPRRVVQLS